MFKPRSSVCRAFQIIQNDTKIVIIPWYFQFLSKFLNFCVGDYVGGHRGAKLSHILEDELEQCASFDTGILLRSRNGIMVSPEKAPKTYMLWGLKLCELRQNQISTRDCISQNNQREN